MSDYLGYPLLDASRAWQPVRGHLIGYYDDNGKLWIQRAPLQSDGSWTPPPADNRAPDYQPPYPAGFKYTVPAGDPKYPAGTILSWDAERGFLSTGESRPSASFVRPDGSSDGHCTMSGFAPDGTWYNVGDESGHPSAPPAGTPGPFDAARAKFLAAVNEFVASAVKTSISPALSTASAPPAAAAAAPDEYLRFHDELAGIGRTKTATTK
jgi:hypothetical protein